MPLGKLELPERHQDIDEPVLLRARSSDPGQKGIHGAHELPAPRREIEALERAEAIGRRLRARPVPAFRETCGWIAYRLGNYDEVLRSSCPRTRWCSTTWGTTYLAVDRPGRARNALNRAVTLTGEDDTRRRSPRPLPNPPLPTIPPRSGRPRRHRRGGYNSVGALARDRTLG